jgi:hypothetical protein
MNCERCQNELEDFLYGELGEAQSAEVRAHLGACAACAALREDLERESQLFSRFYERTSIEPAGEMWEAIRSRIAEGPRPEPAREREAGGPAWLARLRGGAFGWLLTSAVARQAAFAVLLIALSVALTAIYLRRGEKNAEKIAGRNNPTNPTPNSPVPLTPSPVPSPTADVAELGPGPKASGSGQIAGQTPRIPRNSSAPQPPAPRLSDQELMNQQIARAGREYQKAIRMLDQAIAKRRDTLDPEVVKQYESSMALIDKSIADSRRALRDRPDDPTAGQFLLAAYAKKLELMQDIAVQ